MFLTKQLDASQVFITVNNNNNNILYLSDFVLVATSRTLIPKRKVNVHSWIVWRYISISISWLKLCLVESTISLRNFKNIVCSLTHQVEKDSLLRQSVLTIDHCVYQTSFAPVADLTLKCNRRAVAIGFFKVSFGQA